MTSGADVPVGSVFVFSINKRASLLAAGIKANENYEDLEDDTPPRKYVGYVKTNTAKAGLQLGILASAQQDEDEYQSIPDSATTSDSDYRSVNEENDIDFYARSASLASISSCSCSSCSFRLEHRGTRTPSPKCSAVPSMSEEYTAAYRNTDIDVCKGRHASEPGSMLDAHLGAPVVPISTPPAEDPTPVVGSDVVVLRAAMSFPETWEDHIFAYPIKPIPGTYRSVEAKSLRISVNDLAGGSLSPGALPAVFHMLQIGWESRDRDSALASPTAEVPATLGERPSGSTPTIPVAIDISFDLSLVDHPIHGPEDFEREVALLERLEERDRSSTDDCGDVAGVV